MGQFSATPSSSRVMFDEEDNNGLMLCDKYLPVEVLIEIFCHADCKTLLRCQLVCKRWKMLMNHVWHKKTEWTLGKPFPWNDEMPWTVYYLACTKKPYERNLVKNHSGAESFKHWESLRKGYDWNVEEPPIGMPQLPQTEPLFKDRQICFATPYYDWQETTKTQTIILTDEGIHPYILDTYQPSIEVSEWYGCEWCCATEYQLIVTLFRNDDTIIDEFLYRDVVIKKTKRNQWLKMMEQFSATPSSSRVMFDEEDNNGLVLCDKYLPVEMLIEIFYYIADYKTDLLRCQLVCRRWKMLMNHIWHRKTERTLGKPFPWNDEMPWTVYYLACTKKPYERNLVKNHSGAMYMKHWDLTREADWRVEEPPAGMPKLPQTEPLFKDRQICFTTSYIFYSTKVQGIILTDEGIHPYILDTYQPPIEVSEWYSCRYPARYKLKVKLFRNDDTMIDEFLYGDVLKGKKRNQWLKIAHVFKNYGPGLRRITFEHSEVGRSLEWEETYESKMAGACVCVRSP